MRSASERRAWVRVSRGGSGGRGCRAVRPGAAAGLLLGLAVAAGCAASAPEPAPQDAASGDDGGGGGQHDAGPDGGAGRDGSPERDQGGPDPDGGGALPEVGGGAEDGGGELGGFLQPCTQGVDCFSGFCVQAEQGKVCTRPCHDDCPDGWDCRQLLNESGDPTFVCLWLPVLCIPCRSEEQCSSPDNLCLSIGNGTFCGRDCRARGCPGGYACRELDDVVPGARQCVPESGWCTPCQDRDGDGHLGGPDCPDPLDCDESNDRVYLGAAERCDGLDNDCDGEIDEDFDLATDPRHCGACGRSCSLPHAQPTCRGGRCVLAACSEAIPCAEGFVCQRGFCCTDGHWFAGGAEEEGCAYGCSYTNGGLELCDFIDNDCDGRTDEGIDLLGDPAHCGRCDISCRAAGCEQQGASYAAWLAARCFNGQCEQVRPVSCGLYTCDPAAPDRCAQACADDGSCVDGAVCRRGRCEALLVEAEACQRDDQCLSQHCQRGWCCAPDRYNVDGRRENGCECQAAAGAADEPDDAFGDSNCDGIDGDASRALFVAEDGVDGQPGTREQPLRSVARALQLASFRDDVDHVYVSEGTYREALALVNGVSVWGGFSRNRGWQRGPYTAVISNATPAEGRIVAVQGTAITSPTVLGSLTLRAEGTNVVDVSTYALHCTVCTGLVVRNCDLAAGSAGPGVSGQVGWDGGGGSDGANGTNGSCDNEGSPGQGGAGGLSPCGRTGGAGGRGGQEDNDGARGGVGQVGTAGGAGGDGGSTGRRGTDGSHGSNGAPGAQGSGGSAAVRLEGSYWAGEHGAAGGEGQHGNGGGGGGGGGGQGGTWVNDGAGNGGGGGGGGGCGGGGGRGGGAGGGSFGAFLVNSTGIRLEGNRIASGNGGTGGRGGEGGPPGRGGNSGFGASACTNEVGAGGHGGRGGSGGPGGPGGGGAGGPSFAVFRQGTQVALPGNTLFPGAPGPGGSSSGLAGERGAGGPSS